MAATPHTGLSHVDYTVACLCPMGVETAPVEAMLDEIHQPLSFSRDQNAYTLGKLGGHHVVVAVMPEVGNNPAAVVVTQLLNDFPSVRFCLLVGIGGGLPGGRDKHDVRLGDIVVSQPTNTLGGVVHYDLGKKLVNGNFLRIGQLNKPPFVLSANVRKLQAQHRRLDSQIPQYLAEMFKKYPKMQRDYNFPATEPDRLYLPSYNHVSGGTCVDCDIEQTVCRPIRTSKKPTIHYGIIGTANVVVRDAVTRDQLKKDLNIMCLEMEAGGIMGDFPCLVIRGICDYADSHKNEKWQPYAAAVAAAYMKELLLAMPVQQVVQAQHATAFTLPNLPHNAQGGQTHRDTVGKQYNNTGTGQQFNIDTMNGIQNFHFGPK